MHQFKFQSQKFKSFTCTYNLYLANNLFKKLSIHRIQRTHHFTRILVTLKEIYNASLIRDQQCCVKFFQSEKDAKSFQFQACVMETMFYSKMEKKETVNQNDCSKKAQLFCFFAGKEKLAGLEWADSMYSLGRHHIFWSQSAWYLHTSLKGQNIIFRKTCWKNNLSIQ